MKITLAQIRLKTGDFEFNFERAKQAIEHAQGDLIVLPDLTNLGEKDLARDEKFVEAQNAFLQRVAGLGKTIVTGRLHEGRILSENRYFALGRPEPDAQIYVNAVCQADENIYAGGSFAKNAAGEIIYRAPLCEEAIVELDLNAAPALPAPPEKQLIDVMTFALREYCENTGFKKVVLGLSGGIDSAVTATLAVQALGPENVMGILLPSMYSSEGSVRDALKLAQNLGIETQTRPIEPLFKQFMDEFEHRQDLAEENLQARLRALILMFISNRDGRLLLSTGNKSESAMGYGTLYGDLAGGFNMIADLTKTRVYKIAEYLGDVIPRETIEKAPSAELRPGQKDRDSLPEYAVLDDIIEMYIEQGQIHEAIYKKYDKALVDDVIKRIYRAQFKRKQGCLGVRLTERGFNLPIVQQFY